MIRTDLDLINVKKRVHGETTTLYWRLGNPVIRKRRNRNVSGKKWKHTPKRVEAINKFTTGRRLTAAFLLVLGEVSPWRRAARLFGANGQTGENFFFSREPRVSFRRRKNSGFSTLPLVAGTGCYLPGYPPLAGGLHGHP